MKVREWFVNPLYGGAGWYSAGSILLSFLYGLPGVVLGLLALRQLRRSMPLRAGSHAAGQKARKLRIRSLIGITISGLTLIYYLTALFKGTYFRF